MIGYNIDESTYFRPDVAQRQRNPKWHRGQATPDGLIRLQRPREPHPITTTCAPTATRA